jgi:Methyltransferase domain.
VYQLAVNGFDVTGVDYSAASIEIAKGCLKNADSSISNRVSFHLGSATELQYIRTFDLVVAAASSSICLPENSTVFIRPSPRL